MKVGNILHNRYEIRDVRKGGLGIVYIAYDSEWKQLVAIKTFQNADSFAQETKNRFIIEATNWINIGYHENIVYAYYYQVIHNIPYLFMEYVDGYTLRTLVGRKQPLPALVAHTIEVCVALRHVYEKFKMIHRDIKPDNIFVTTERAGEFNIAKVADFGLSKVLIPDNIIRNPEVLVSLQKQSLYVTQGIVGTLFYVSPEQILGETNIDCTSDIYSLGVTLYELVTHRLPFYLDSTSDPTRDRNKLLYKHLNAKPLEPRKLNLNIPRALNKIILKCLEKKREKRFANYDALIDELNKAYKTVRDSNVITSQDFYEIEVTPIHSEKALLTNKAASYSEMGNYREAIAIFDKILKAEPNNVYTLCNKAQVLMELREYDLSIALLKKALSIEESDAETWSLLGIAYSNMEKHHDALVCVDKALELAPHNLIYMKDKAFRLKDVGKLGDAVCLFKKIAEIKPSDFSAWHELALLYEREGRTNEAIQHYMKALDINPEFTYSLDNLGSLLCQIGDLEGGIPYIEKALRYDPNNPKTWNHLGCAYGKIGRYEKAIEALKEAIRIKPDYAIAHYSLGIAFGKIGHYQEAIEAYKQAIRLRPDYVDAHYNLGLDYCKLGCHQEAIEAFNQVIRMKSDDAEAHNNLGTAYARLGYYQEAMEAFKEAIRIKPDYASAHYNLGHAYLILGNKDFALLEYEILKSMDSDQVEELKRCGLGE